MLNLGRIVRTIGIGILICTLVSIDVFASYNERNPYGMHWKGYGDGTFAWIPEENNIKVIVRQGAWYKNEDGTWSFYMSSDGAKTFLPLKSCSAFINFNDDPMYNLYTFDKNGVMIGGEYRNLVFPPPGVLFVNIYATNLHLKMQPGGICVVDGTVVKGSIERPSLWR